MNSDNFNSTNNQNSCGEQALKNIEWMLANDSAPGEDAKAVHHEQDYGDLTDLNRDGLILKSIGREQLESFVNDSLELLGTSSAIYETNGNYAFGIFTSGWCRMMDCASRELCGTPDNKEALNSGRWLCHESCWTDCSKRAIAENAPVDIACRGGLRIYAVPILAHGNVVGAINFGYGDPPTDQKTLQKLAKTFHLDVEDLVREANAYDSRPPFIIELAKKRLHATARLIGSMIETKQTEAALSTSRDQFSTLLAHLPGMAYRCKNDADWTMLFVSKGCQSLTGYTPKELTGDGAMPYEPIIHPDDRQYVRKQVESALQKGGNFEVEYRIVTKDGTEKWVWERGAESLDGTQKHSLIEGFISDITGRKQAEQALHASEETMRTTLHSIGDAVISTDRQGQVVAMNPVAESLTGWSENDALGYPLETVFRIINEQTRQPAESPASNVLKSGHIVGLANHTLLLAKDGREIPIADSGAPIRNEAGEITGVVLVFRDQTEERAARQALETSQQSLESMFRASPVGIGMVRSRVIVEANDLLCEITGYSREEMIGKSAQMLYPTLAEFDRVGTEKYRQILRTGTGTIETVWKRKDGVLMDIWLSSSALDRTDLVKGVTFTALDITERKRIERKLIEQKDLLGAIYRNAPLVMMVVNAERRIQQINGFATQFASRDTEEILGLRGGEALRCLHALDDPRGCGFGESCQHCVIRNTVLDTLETGTTHLQVEAPYYFKGPNHETREIEFLMSTTPIQVKSERMALVTLQDITERKQAELEKENLQAQLTQAQKMESAGRLAGGVAHDFNNLLMGIMNYTDMCRDEIDEDHPIREWLDEITADAQRSANLTKQLLAFARKQTISPQVLELNDTVANMLKMLQQLIGEDVDLHWQPGANVPSVKMDPAQVDQILANLCINARDAIEGVGKITIETKNVVLNHEYCDAHPEAGEGQFAVLEVSDDGCGIDHETRDLIFEPFFTTKPSGEGTGLGLATVYGIVKQNEGFVNVYSEPGEGTTIRIYLPSCRKEVSTEKTAINPDQTPFVGQETVLLVEDERSIRKTLRRFLDKLGYTILTAESPKEALGLVAEHGDTIDLLITDVIMPGMSGRDLAQKMMPDHPDMKIIYMSGYTANVIAHRGILEEDVAFLSKPFPRDELAAKVREVLDGG